MTTSGDHELHTLAGAYAMDAVTPDERARFASHLADCAQCQLDVREMHEATARLGLAAAVRPRPELKEQTIRAAFMTSQLAPVVSDPVVSDPVVSDPVVSDPVVSDPVVSDPVVSDAVVSDAVVSDAVVSDPVVSDPVVSDPVVSDMSRVRQDRPEPGPRGQFLRRARTPGQFALAAAVVVVALAVGFGLMTNNAMRQLHDAQGNDHMIARVIDAPDAVILTVKIRAGGTATIVMSHREHRLVFTANGLRQLPSGKMYELWLMGPAGTRPAGMIKPESDGTAGPAVVSGLGPRDMIGMTVEPASGSPLPTSTVVVLIRQHR